MHCSVCGSSSCSQRRNPVGVGGAIVVIPLLLYGPPLVGVGALDLRSVAAITMVQFWWRPSLA